MKTKNLFIILGLVLLSSCTTRNYLNKTVWINITPVAQDSGIVNLVTSLYFWDKNTVTFYTAVEKDKARYVAPFLSSVGKYTCKGKLKKGIDVAIDVKNIIGDTVNYKGVLIKAGMVLTTFDNKVSVFSLVSNAKIE
jgi:hypothetical protein